MEFEDIKQKNLFENKPLAVGQFVNQLNARLKPFSVKIIGEVSEAKPGPTGHMYFSLKDENGGAVMPCALWKSRYDVLGIELKVGMKIIAAGHAEVYAPSGRLSFICDSVELAGEGALKAAYDKLLQKLTAEGLFAAEKKRPVPKYCRRVGIITAKQGAVIHDFLNNIGKFGFQIEFIDSRVEGQLAVGDLLASINTFKNRQIDALVIMRGGGSLEAMLAFNNEAVVRQIAGFPAPVIAAIGHDKDVPLAALAADAMCSTPTAAANLLTQSWQEIFKTLDRHQINIIGGFRNSLAQKQTQLHRYAEILANFKYILQTINRRIEAIMANSLAALKNSLSAAIKQLLYFENIIESRDPEQQLKIGYAIARVNGKIIKSVAQTNVGDAMNVQVFNGCIDTDVRKIAEKINR